MRQFDKRFKEPAPPELIERLADLPAGSTATVRGIVFRKVRRYRWANDFRVGMSDRQVASVLAEGDPYEIIRADIGPHGRFTNGTDTVYVQDMTTTYNARTASGVVHTLTVGRTFQSHGSTRTNRDRVIGERAAGKADCGALTSMAARCTDAPTTCPKCLAVTR